MTEVHLEELRNRRNELMGYRVTEVANGRSHLVWSPGEELSNPIGIVHGGFVGVMVDDTCGTAVASTLDNFQAFPTASMHIDFLRGIPIGGTYECLGTVRKAGRRLTVVDAEIVDQEERVLAKGTCTFVLERAGGRGRTG